MLLMSRLHSSWIFFISFVVLITCCIPKVKASDSNLKRFGFYFGLCHLKPEVQGLDLEKNWSIFGSAAVKLTESLALELRHDTYKSSQTTTFAGEQAAIDVKMKGFTGYLLYCLPRDEEKEKWEFDVGFGLGEHKFDFFYDSDTINHHRWFKLDTFEIKLGAEYCFTESYRMGIELRGIFGDEQIDLDDLGETVNVDLDGFYVGISQRYCF